MEETYQTVRAGWLAGNRDREAALHLLFLSWYHWAEPDFLTGLSDDTAAPGLWMEVFGFFGGEGSSDAEFLILASVMLAVAPWMLGGTSEVWAGTAQRLRARFNLLKPDGLAPEVFAGRGDYGDYFEHQSNHQGSFVA